MFSVGLDEITSDSPALSRQRKAATKATEEQRKKLTDEDEDYEPKLTPGCHPVTPPWFLFFITFLCISKITITPLQIQKVTKISVNQPRAKTRNSQ